MAFRYVKRPTIKSLTDAFFGCKKVEKTFWFCDIFIFQRQRIYFTVQLRMQSSKPGM